MLLKKVQMFHWRKLPLPLWPFRNFENIVLLIFLCIVNTKRKTKRILNVIIFTSICRLVYRKRLQLAFRCLHGVYLNKVTLPQSWRINTIQRLNDHDVPETRDNPLLITQYLHYFDNSRVFAVGSNPRPFA